MNNDTQPLTEEQVAEWSKGPILLGDWTTPHIHGPFTFLLNQNHNALRGCTSCGQTWVGFMAGSSDDIRWHSVQEPPEEEE